MKHTIESLQNRLAEMIQCDLLQTPPDFHHESNLFDFGLDSMAIMQFLLLLEEEFQLSIPVESVSLENFKNVKSVAALLASKLSIEGNVQEELIEQQGGVAQDGFQPQPFAFRPEQEDLHEGQFDTLALQGTDLFVCGFEAYNQKRGLRGHWAYTLVELDRVPDPSHLKTLSQWLPQRYAIINAALTKQQWFKPQKLLSTTFKDLPLQYWYPVGSKPEEDSLSGEYDTSEIDGESGEKRLLRSLINDRVDRRAGPPRHLNFDVIVKVDGTSLFVMSWNHLIFDGLGAEWFIQELQRLWSGSPSPVVPSYSREPFKLKPWGERYASAKAMIDRFRYIIGQRYASLGSAEFCDQQKVDFEVVTLNEEQSLQFKARVKQFCGELVQMPFFLACVMRAHHAVHVMRGELAEDMLTSIPVQLRKKGSLGPLFQNHLTMFYVRLTHEHCKTLSTAVSEVIALHTEFIKEKLGESFADMMDMTRFMPPTVNMNLILKQMKGVLSSFYHSNTGVFANGLKELLGCRILNAYHVPGIGGPPGTGVFFSESQDKITVVTCWIKGSFRTGEVEVFRKALWNDLGFEQIPPIEL